MKLIKNAIQCKHCGKTIESTYRHDFAGHWCEAMGHTDNIIAADGGLDYLRRVGSKKDWLEVSEWEDE